MGFGALTCRIQGYKCPRCNNNFGYLFMEDTGFLYFCAEKDCMKDDSDCSKALKTKAKEEPREASVLFHKGERYRNACLANWEAENHHKENVLSWLKSPKNFLVITGNPKTGKTYFCMAVANWLMKEGRHVKYLVVRSFFEEIQDAIAKNENQYARIRKIAQNEVLIIDDLGASTNSEWQKEVLLDLIDQRYSEKLPTIVTTNLSWDTMKEDLGERIERRLNSKENLRIVVVKQYD